MRIPGTTHRHRVMIYAAVALLLLAAAGALTEIRSDKFRILARDFLTSMCARRIEVGEASFNLLGRVTLRDVRIYNDSGYAAPLLFSAPVIRFQLGWTGGETSAFRPTRIRIERPEIWFERDWSHPWNTDEFWVKKPPRRDHPTFSLPISVRDATIHLSDGRVGSAGFAMDFHSVAIDHTVMSDGAEITNNTSAQDIRLPRGGTMSLTLFTHPNARQASATLLFRDAEVTQLAPYTEFIRLVSFKTGSLNGPIRIGFDRGDVSYDAAFSVTGAAIRHAASGTQQTAPEMTIAFKSTTRDTRIEVAEFTTAWKGSRLTGRGVFSTRNAPDSFTDFLIDAPDARGEDLSFLLCDPSFEATGPVSGRCTLASSPEGDLYDIDVDLDRADARYAQIIRKPPGAHGRLGIHGHSRGRLDRVAIEVGGSRAELLPGENQWKLDLPKLDGEDVSRYLTAFAELPGFMLRGPVEAAFTFARGGGVTGTVDFRNAEAELSGWMKKAAGEPASLRLDGHFERDRVDARRCEARFGSSRIFVSGAWKPDEADLTLDLDELAWKDARRYCPAAMETMAQYANAEGEASGRIGLHRSGGAWLATAALTLDRTALEVPHVGLKARGVPSTLRVNATYDGRRVEVPSGWLSLGATQLGLRGGADANAYVLHFRGDATPLDGFRQFLASKLWPAIGQIAITGPGDLEITVDGSPGSASVDAKLDATAASIALGDTWAKPAGEPFSIATRIVRHASGTEIERFSLAQGTSTLSCAGSISGGSPSTIDCDVKADIDVTAFLDRTPALDRVQISGRKASDSLRLVADADQRARLTGRLEGPLDQPKLSWFVEQLMTRVIINSLTRQLRRITSLFSSPIESGLDALKRGDRLDTGSRPRLGHGASDR